MAQKKKHKRPPAVIDARKRVWLLALGFLLVQIAVLPGAASPFRAPKTVLALTLILLVCGLSWVGQCLRGRIEVRWSPLASVLISLPVILAVSAAWSSSPQLALNAAVESAIWIVGALWIATATENERGRLIGAAATGAAISGLILMAQAVGIAVFTLGPAGPTGRKTLTGLTGNPADLCMAAVLLLPLVLVSMRGSKRPWLGWTFALILTAAAVFSQTMTGLVALALVWGTWLFQQRSRRLWLTAAAVAVVLVGVGLATGLDTRIKRQVTRFERGDWYSLLSARSDGWTAAGEMVRSHPLTGTGGSNFTHAYYPARIAWLDRTGSIGHRSELATHFRFAHSDPLQVAAELGIVGILWMATLVVVLFRCQPRGDPLPPLALAGFMPFVLLHFPTHLAVGLLPVILTLGYFLGGARTIVVEPGPIVRRLGAVLLVALILTGTYWQLHRLMLNLWRGGLNHAISVAQELEEPERSHQAAIVEAQIMPRMAALGNAQSWLWRTAGQARMLRGDDAGAETAYRNAMSLWPHEEAEFGLGMALAAQDRRLDVQGRRLDTRNRRGEAIVHLARVCRTNPALLKLIEEEDLRRAVAVIVEAADTSN